MRKPFRQALRRLFTAQMKDTLPQFEATSVSSDYFWPGDHAFRWRVRGQEFAWIVLSPSKKDYDEFTVLVGWSTRGRFPELSMVPCAEPPATSRDEFLEEEYFTRLPSLWTPEDDWWVVRPFHAPRTPAELEASLVPPSAAEAEEAAKPKVEDALAKLREYGAPYLQEWADHRRNEP